VEDFDLDSILEKATTVAYEEGKDKAQRSLSSFSTATFAASAEDKGVDINDVNFWEKVLPSFKTTSKMIEAVQEPSTLDTEEKREKFLADINVLVQELEQQRETQMLQSRHNFDPSSELFFLIKKSEQIVSF